MFRSHFRTLQRHYELYGTLRESDNEDEEPTAGPSANLAATSGGEASKITAAGAQNPNDLWFKPGSARGTKGKGKDTTADDAMRSRYQRMYNVRWPLVSTWKLIVHDALRSCSKGATGPRVATSRLSTICPYWRGLVLTV